VIGIILSRSLIISIYVKQKLLPNDALNSFITNVNKLKPLTPIKTLVKNGTQRKLILTIN